MKKISFPQAYICLRTSAKIGEYTKVTKGGSTFSYNSKYSTELLVEQLKKNEHTIFISEGAERFKGYGIVFEDSISGELFIETIEKEVAELEKSL